MAANVGSADRAIRLILGIVFFVVAFAVTMSPGWKWVLIILGIIALFTGLVRFCALYSVFHINTAKKR